MISVFNNQLFGFGLLLYEIQSLFYLINLDTMKDKFARHFLEIFSCLEYSFT